MPIEGGRERRGIFEHLKGRGRGRERPWRNSIGPSFHSRIGVV